MYVLCEDCFPDWQEYEVYTIVPMSPCMICGQYDNRHEDGVKCHAFTKYPLDGPFNGDENG